MGFVMPIRYIWGNYGEEKFLQVITYNSYEKQLPLSYR